MQTALLRAPLYAPQQAAALAALAPLVACVYSTELSTNPNVEHISTKQVTLELPCPAGSALLLPSKWQPDLLCCSVEAFQVIVLSLHTARKPYVRLLDSAREHGSEDLAVVPTCSAVMT